MAQEENYFHILLRNLFKRNTPKPRPTDTPPPFGGQYQDVWDTAGNKMQVPTDEWVRQHYPSSPYPTPTQPNLTPPPTVRPTFSLSPRPTFSPSPRPTFSAVPTPRPTFSAPPRPTATPLGLPSPTPVDRLVPAQRNIVSILAQRGSKAFGAGQVNPLLALIEKESSYNPSASNPGSTARGLFQFLTQTSQKYGLGNDASKAPLDRQIEAGLRYIKDRYGTPQKAAEFHAAHGWF